MSQLKIKNITRINYISLNISTSRIFSEYERLKALNYDVPWNFLPTVFRPIRTVLTDNSELQK